MREAITRSLKSGLRLSDSSPYGGDDLWALRDVSFSLPPGRALGLIGPNGSGKTTALKILAKITRPTSGRTTTDGRVAALIELGAGFHPDLTGRENVYLNGAILGLSKGKIDRLFDRIVAFSGLERFVDTPVKRYSSGMYVRLGFSIAAHVDAEILLVDEVLAVGDAQFRQKCSERIEDLRQQGTTIVFVAHNLFLVKSVCDSGLFLLDGQVRAAGDIFEVIQEYEKWLHGQSAAWSDHPEGQRGESSSSIIGIKAVEIGNPEQPPSERLAYDQPAEIRVHFRASKAVKKPNLVLRIQRADGLTCAMIRTLDLGLKFGTLEGNGILSVVLDPLQLAGGAFSIEARLLGAIDGVPLAIANSPRFQVVGPSLSHEAVSGVFVPHIASAQLHQPDD